MYDKRIEERFRPEPGGMSSAQRLHRLGNMAIFRSRYYAMLPRVGCHSSPASMLRFRPLFSLFALLVPALAMAAQLLPGIPPIPNPHNIYSATGANGSAPW